MEANRLRPQEILAGVGGLALLISLFLPWAELDCGGAGAFCDPSVSGWSALSVIDLLLALMAAGAIALPVVAATNRKSDAPIAGDALVAFGACISLLLILFRLADPVGDASPGAGPFVALAATVLILAGSWKAMADEGSA